VRLLIVEDDPFISELLGDGLTEEGYDCDLAATAAEGEALVELEGRPFRIRQQFVDDAGSHSLKAHIAGLRRALLVMHAPNDTTVSLSNAMEIFTAAKHPKSFVSLDDADHLLTGRNDAAYVANVIAAWSARYINKLA